MGQIEEKLSKALKDKEEDITGFTWKYPKDRGTGSQIEVKLVDCSLDELIQFQTHAKSMLLSKEKDSLGRIPLLKEILDQQLRCSTELFLRFSESIGNSRIAVLDALKTSIKNNNLGILDTRNLILSDLVNVATEYRGIPVPMLIDGCLDQLGKFDRRHITLSFITKQGLWFTKEESRDLWQLEGNNEPRPVLEVVHERLKLSKDIKLFLTPTGLSYTEFRAMTTLKSRKYSELTTDQLKTLRKRILYNLEDDVKKHIYFWERKLEELTKVINYKEVPL